MGRWADTNFHILPHLFLEKVFLFVHLPIRPISTMKLEGAKMKESFSKHNSLIQFSNKKRIQETNATGVDQEIDNDYYHKNWKQWHRLCDALGIDMNLFKLKDSMMFNVTPEVERLFLFFSNNFYEKRRKYYRMRKQISAEKWEKMQHLLLDALQSCNVSGKKIKQQLQILARKRTVYVYIKNSRTKHRPMRLPAQYFRGTSLEMTPIVGNDPTLSEEEFRNAYQLAP